MQALLTRDFDYNKSTNTFVAEISELPFLTGIPKKFQLINPKTDGVRTFEMVGQDRDGSGEDIYGFRYKTSDNIHLLIIND